MHALRFKPIGTLFIVIRSMFFVHLMVLMYFTNHNFTIMRYEFNLIFFFFVVVGSRIYLLIRLKNHM